MNRHEDNLLIRQTRLAKFLSLESVQDAKRRLKHGIYLGLGITGVSLFAGIAEPGILKNEVVTFTTGDTDKEVFTVSEGDRIATLGVISGGGLAISGAVGLRIINKELDKNA